MTQGFDDWQWNYGDSLQSSEVPKVKKAYLAGAASRQAEIDALSALGEMSEQNIDDLVLRNIELQKQIDTLKQEAMREREQGTEFFTDCENMKAERDALQKRIDDALKVLNDASPTMLDKKAIKILKGKTE